MGRPALAAGVELEEARREMAAAVDGVAESLDDLGRLLRERPLLGIAVGLPVAALAVLVAWRLPGVRKGGSRLRNAALSALASAAVGAAAALAVQRALRRAAPAGEPARAGQPAAAAPRALPRGAGGPSRQA